MIARHMAVSLGIDLPSITPSRHGILATSEYLRKHLLTFQQATNPPHVLSQLPVRYEPSLRIQRIAANS